MNVSTELRSDAMLHSALVSCAAIFQTKGHGDIAVCPERGDKRCFNLIFYNKFDLVIAGSGIQKR